jgi:hypothetical protein
VQGSRAGRRPAEGALASAGTPSVCCVIVTCVARNARKKSVVWAVGPALVFFLEKKGREKRLTHRSEWRSFAGSLGHPHHDCCGSAPSRAPPSFEPAACLLSYPPALLFPWNGGLAEWGRPTGGSATLVFPALAQQPKNLTALKTHIRHLNSER